jgi:molybdopterin synthase sulfur carrier subunit
MAAVRLYAGLREAAGQRDFEVDLPAGALIGELLKRLIALRPKLDGKILDENGHVPQYVAVFVNGRDIRHLNGLGTPVQPEDEIAIFPPVAGGWSGNGYGTDWRMVSAVVLARIWLGAV